ncbi:type III PLP-dependent enzyme domain-containing protein [Bradyrhizobium japonicum]|uniref:hypothetical protein n=1 Tax=Bradyrhizobium japonicum TaxID=375 RepID=UPI00384D681D
MALRPTIAAFGQIEGQLAVGGVPLARLAERIGSTPFFAYDRALLTDRVKLLRSTLPRRIKLSYAIKANPMPAVTQHLATLVDAFDVASASEMRTALDTPMRPANVSFAGPGKNEASIAQAVASGVIIEIESATEVARVIKAGERLGVRPRIAVRVNPDFEVKGSGMRMGGGSTAVRHRCRKGAISARRPRGSGRRVSGIPCLRRVPEPERRSHLLGAASHS